MITPELKDRILFDLVDGPAHAGHVLTDECTQYDLDYYTYNAILEQFERLGFIRSHSKGDGLAVITISADAHDFVRQGGFTIQEEIRKADINKLGLELEKLSLELDKLSKDLSSSLAERAQKFLELANALVSVFKLGD